LCLSSTRFIISPIIAFISSNPNCVKLWREIRQIPFIIEATLSEIVLTNMGLNLLGITLAVLTLLEALIDTEIDPILLRDSDTEIKQPF
jgi:hypothetical protein